MERSQESKWTFPFGAPLLPARAASRGRARVFVVGVYSSAVHARWLAPDGKKVLCRALAVAPEPYAFWDGSGVERLVAAIQRSVPESVGRLEPADADFNGPSGRALDEQYLRPLGLARSDCWVTDIHDLYYLSPGNRAALAKHYEPLVRSKRVPRVALPLRPSSVSPSKEQLARLEKEFKRAAPDWVITLGNEPLRPTFGTGIPRLSTGDYGRPFEAEVFGRRLRGLALCHPRQAARLGPSSRAWFEAHQRWQSDVRRWGIEGLSKPSGQ